MASMNVDKVDVHTYLATAASTVPASLQPYFEKFRTQYDRRLWHQLTLTLENFYKDPESPPYHFELFNGFISDFAPKLNQLKLAELGVRASQQLDDPSEVITFLVSFIAKISKEEAPEAYLLLLAQLAHAKMILGDDAGAQVDIEESSKIIDTLDGVEPTVHAAYYGVAADYYKTKADYVKYYKNSLLYLACVDPAEDLTPVERLTRAHDLGVSALLGETIYNFGELLMHPILDALDGSEHAWLKELLFVFNEGNIGRFEALGPQLSKRPSKPILAPSFAFLRQKICLMALIEAVFSRSANNRSMTFQTISEEVRLPKNEVEHLVMKALSLKLVRGRIDQVDEKIQIDWVQPRVLSRTQIKALAGRLTDWIDRLGKVDEFVQSNSKLLAV
ncbi:proteasome 26S subunit [Clavulina sp. PMI_390]|nr:proteasome 26S subunit [Clavulina sp. PMI_390]